MLQVCNLTKIYKTKGGVEVRALDNVSLSFSETGMVFLLGKSGSGKSTLLNVCGGLDAPTSGEIIVKGRSSKNFSQSDFDSYRNTYIGFIFQEYNILNEFSVEDNIALALELQGKPKDKAAIAKLLEDVDLSGYAKRKPNTLSGGQKQRIAIARALIKSPEIIMADEPTGALDSATGKQVFDTLKKLSKNKLVIVVSHDRDFAEEYGDRIIELKDGQILSDVTKTHEEQRAISDNVTFIGSTINVKNGANLTDKDFQEIKSFLKTVHGDVMIASGEKEVQNFRAANRITSDGQKEVFRTTDESAIQKKEYTDKERKFIRSHLPVRHAFTIGVSGLKTKPIRLFFTILLCTMAFILFGLASTMTFYNRTATFKQSFIDSNIYTLKLAKEYRTITTSYYNDVAAESWEEYDYAAFSDEDVKTYAEQFGGDTFGAVTIDAMLPVKELSDYYLSNISSFATLSENNGLREKIIGRYPQSDNEIVLSSYTAEVALACKAEDAFGNALNLKQPTDIIGKTLLLNSAHYTVVGLLQTDPLPTKFDAIRDNTKHSWSLEIELHNLIQESLRLVAFVTEKHLQDTVKNMAYIEDSDDDYYYREVKIAMEKNADGSFVYPENYGADGYYSYASNIENNVAYIKKGVSSVGEMQVVVTPSHFNKLARAAYDQKFEAVGQDFENACLSWINANQATFDTWQEQAQTQGSGFAYGDLEEVLSAWLSADESAIPSERDGELYTLYQSFLSSEINTLVQHLLNYERVFVILDNLQRNCEEVDGQEIPLSKQRRTELFEELATAFERDNLSLQIGIQLVHAEYASPMGEEYALDVVGVIDAYDYENYFYDLIIYLNDTQVDALWEIQKASFLYGGYLERTTKYLPDEKEIYDTLFIPYNHSKATTNRIYSLYKNQNIFDERDTHVILSSSLIETLELINSTIALMSKIFLWTGVVIAAFAALLLSNFISVSISYKKREIGILRAVGARGMDVFKIFFSESFVITSICLVISLIFTLLLCNTLNNELGAGLGASIFNFGILSLITLLGIAFITAFLATFLPVWIAAKKKPVDSIRAL